MSGVTPVHIKSTLWQVRRTGKPLFAEWWVWAYPLTLPWPDQQCPTSALTSSPFGAGPLHQHALLGGWPLDPPHLSRFTEELWGHVQIGGQGPPGARGWGRDWRQVRSQLVDGTHRVRGKGYPTERGGGRGRGRAGEGCGAGCGGRTQGRGSGWA